MGRHSLTLLIGLVAASTLYAADSQVHSFPTYFEQTSESRWAGRGDLQGLVIQPARFVLASKDSPVELRWDPRMGLTDLSGLQPLDSHSYELFGDHSITWNHAEQVQASGQTPYSVRYYKGSRGIEFDIELKPGAAVFNVSLQAPSAKLSIGPGGELLADGQSIAAKPVAYQVGVSGTRSVVPAAYQLLDDHRIGFSVGAYDPSRALIIDPIITAAYSLSPPDAPQGTAARVARTLGDDIVLLGITTPDIGFMLHPGQSGVTRCYVARYSLTAKRFKYVSYFGHQTSQTFCQDMDVDSEGQVFVVGYTQPFSAMITPDAQWGLNWTNTTSFLTRIAANGRTIEYATYLPLSNTASKVRASSQGRVYMIATSAASNLAEFSPGGWQSVANRGFPTALMLYDTVQRRFLSFTYFQSQGTDLGEIYSSALEIAPSGAVYIAGMTSVRDLPQRTPISFMSNYIAGRSGFVAAFTPDLKDLVLSSYVGAQSPGFSSVATISFPDPFTVQLFGTYARGSTAGTGIVELPPLTRVSEFTLERMFWLNFTPGATGVSAGAMIEDLSTPSYFSALVSRQLPSGHICFNATRGPVGVVGNHVLACLRPDGKELESITVLQQDSRQFSLLGMRGVPQGLRILTNLTDAGRATSTQVLDYDISIRKPVLLSPRSMIFKGQLDVALNTFLGENFDSSLSLHVGGYQIPLTAVSSTRALMPLNSPAYAALSPGHYSASLSNQFPQSPQFSDTFDFTVQYLPPSTTPIAGNTVVRPRTLRLNAPIYDSSEVYWRGQRMTLLPAPNASQREFEIPEELFVTGISLLEIRNPQPGGGTMKINYQIGGGRVEPQAVQPGPVSYISWLQTIDYANRLVYFIPSSTSQPLAIGVASLDRPQEFRNAVVQPQVTKTIRSMAVSSDGAYLYLMDATAMLYRFRTDTLSLDLQFQAPFDTVPNGVGATPILIPVQDAPETIVAMTPSMRLIVYDGSLPRPYGSIQFPTSTGMLYPILATPDAVYALQWTGGSAGYGACVVRHPLDSLGLGEPEYLCDPLRDWSKYPELIRRGTHYFIADRWRGVEVAFTAAPDVVSRTSYVLDMQSGLVLRPQLTIVGSGQTAARRVVFNFEDPSTDQQVARYPSVGYLDNALGLIAGDRLVITVSASPPRIYLQPDWRALSVLDAP